MSADAGRFSECVVHDEGDTVRLEWLRRGHTYTTLVADPLVEEWVASENELRAFGAERVRLQQALEAATTLIKAQSELLDWALFEPCSEDAERDIPLAQDAVEAALAAWRAPQVVSEANPHVCSHSCVHGSASSIQKMQNPYRANPSGGANQGDEA